MASQMSSAIFDAMTVDVKAANYLFRATGSQLKFPGFLQIYQEGSEAAPRQMRAKTDSCLNLRWGNRETAPAGAGTALHPAPGSLHRSDAGQNLGRRRIGRPSTYAPIIDTIVARGYVEREEKRFRPSELGIIVTDLLAESFPDCWMLASPPA